MIKFLKRIRSVAYACREAFRYGGINTVSIKSIEQPELLYNMNILITGGSSGIGLAIAKKCVNCGANVIITGRNEDKLKQAVKDINSSHLSYLVWDISDTDAIFENISKAEVLFGGDVDSLINCAGVAPKEFYPNVSLDEWNRIYRTNSMGPYFLSTYLCERWSNRNDKMNSIKKIIFISSQGGFVGATYPYRLSKWDIVGLTEGLGKQVCKHGILVNGIAPGVVKTEMQQFSLNQGENTPKNSHSKITVPKPIKMYFHIPFIQSHSFVKLEFS